MWLFSTRLYSLEIDRSQLSVVVDVCYEVVEVVGETTTDESNTVRYYLIDKVTGFKPEGIDLMNEFNYMQTLSNAIKLAKECEARNHHEVDIWRETKHGNNVRVIWK